MDSVCRISEVTFAFFELYGATFDNLLQLWPPIVQTPTKLPAIDYCMLVLRYHDRGRCIPCLGQGVNCSQFQNYCKRYSVGNLF